MWIHGKANTGKTTITEMLNEIFICHAHVETNSHFDYAGKETEYEPQIVLMDETNCEKLFAPRNVAAMKKLLEGKGIINKEKFGALTVKFTDASIVLTSNDLPFSKLIK